ncbi:hypothetical protein BZL30_4148 [Mycobacterium kansasii]|uniref:Uncharacterized protein n=1 Tax=Mycobacterium kansasii TaxID=1768 RepID=A0A1V3XBJ1_MYCKA|nr:hypothetical protein BZL30_4148 [Mycobacterium kansasii]
MKRPSPLPARPPRACELANQQHEVGDRPTRRQEIRAEQSSASLDRGLIEADLDVDTQFTGNICDRRGMRMLRQ